ncbi:TonB-dependent receptor [Reichenbachiella sp.]|uniref:TonB-dependent receptor domain-containing protein n=1 Tax=Reichenbachiella sp. TaxID=2184521 RepID=UPI003299B9A8
MAKKIFFFLFFQIYQLGFINLYAQPSGRPGGSGESNPFKITGQLMDKESGSPLEYASASLFSVQDSSLVDGAITNEGGVFTITPRPGKYYLRLQFISYKQKFVNNLVLNRENKVIDLGTINMLPDSETLDEVVVAAKRDQMQLELDKRVFNVSENLSNVGANASEIMDNLPSVSVDVEGNISLRGSGNVRILVNGKPSGLVGISDANGLRQLQGNLIERIEVITNPSARYDAEGSPGIINIILKKEREKGFNGSFTTNLGYPANYGFSGSVNYRAGNFNVFGSYGINYRENPGGGYSRRIGFGTDTLITHIDNERVRSDVSHTYRLGTDYYINENNILTASGLVKIANEENTTDITYYDWDVNDALLSNTFRKDFEKEDDDNYEYQLSYRRIMEGEGHELTADFQYRSNDETERSSIDSANLLTDSDQLMYQRSINVQGDKNIMMQLDYVNPFADGKKIEVGYRGTIRKISSDYLVEQIDDQGNWYPYENFSNRFEYDENVHAAYGIFENKMDKWGYQLGIRLEQTFISTYQRETDISSDKNYLNAFPSAFVSYKFDKMRSIQASYSRRISRPRFWYLNPFSSFSDPRNIRTGNTDLDPEYADSYELGTLYNLETASIYVGGYYRYTTGVIDRIETSEDGYSTVSTPYNIGTANAYGIETNFSVDPLDWLNINGNANFYRAITKGEYKDIELKRDTYTARFRLNNKVKIGKVNIQLSGWYRAPEKTTQGKRKSMYAMDLGSNVDVMKGNGTLTFFMKDVFNSRRYRGSTFSTNFIEESEFQWRSRQVGMSFTYRINQKKSRSRGERGEGEGMDGGDF